SDARGRVLEGHHGKSCGSGAWQGRHHGEQERDTFRSESADGRQRHSHRDTRRHHARHARTRNGRDRRSDRPRAPDSGERQRAGHGACGSRGPVPEVPSLPGVTLQERRMAELQESNPSCNPTILQSCSLAEATVAAFSAAGPLAVAMPEFEARAGQVDMAAAVARVFERGGVLLAEAGTGTGKTLAYLVPAILNRERVLISTGTKNLQEQIYFKDIPALRDALGIPFTATYMKGRANYLCLHKLDQ